MMQLAVLTSIISHFDSSFLAWLQDHANPHAIPVLQFVSSTTTIVSISLTLSILLLYFFRRSKTLLIRFFALTSVLIVVGLTTLGLKTAITRERPFVNHPDIEKLSEAGSASFPSGHTLEAFAVAIAVTILFPGKKRAIPIYLWAMLVGYSRMALGVHYPTDVLGGIVIGTIIGFGISLFFLRFLNKDK